MYIACLMYDLEILKVHRQILTSIHKTNILLKEKTEVQAEVRYFFQLYI